MTMIEEVVASAAVGSRVASIKPKAINCELSNMALASTRTRLHQSLGEVDGGWIANTSVPHQRLGLVGKGHNSFALPNGVAGAVRDFFDITTLLQMRRGLSLTLP